MPSVPSIDSTLKEVAHESAELPDAGNAEFSKRLGEGSARKTEEPAAAQAGTGSRQGAARPTLLSLPPEIQQEIIRYAAADNHPVRSYVAVRNTRLTHRTLESAFLGDASLKQAYTNAYNAYKDVTPEGRKNLALQDIDRSDLTADQAIARNDVTNIVAQGLVREAGAKRDVKTGLFSADAAIGRHKILNVGMQRRVRLAGGLSDIRDRNMTSSAAIQRQGVRDPADQRVLRQARIIHSGGEGLTKEEGAEFARLVNAKLNADVSLGTIRTDLGMRQPNFDKLMQRFFDHDDSDGD